MTMPITKSVYFRSQELQVSWVPVSPKSESVSQTILGWKLTFEFSYTRTVNIRLDFWSTVFIVWPKY